MSVTLPDAVWRAGQLARFATPVFPSGFAALDAQLPGAGWPGAMLTELISREPGIGELRLLVPLLRRLTQERRFTIMLGPPQIPYAPALAAYGIDPDYLLIVEAAHAAHRLWAIEQALRSSSCGALLAWLPPRPHTRPEHLRRMQLAARTGHGPAFLFRPLDAQFEASPAPLRLLLLPQAEERLAVHILKRRGPLAAAPILVDLPRPPLSIRLRTSSSSAAATRAAAPSKTDTASGRTLRTVHRGTAPMAATPARTAPDHSLKNA